MNGLAGLFLTLAGAKHPAGVDIVVKDPAKYGVQALVVGCAVVLVLGCIQHLIHVMRKKHSK